MTIRNPVEWGIDRLKSTTRALEPVSGRARTSENSRTAPLEVRRIKMIDLKDVLVKGFGDFGANRTDVMFLCIIYPIIGTVLARLAAGYEMLPLLFPLASGFALVGPVAAIGLYEMSRRREIGRAHV